MLPPDHSPTPIAHALLDAERAVPCPTQMRAEAHRALVQRLERAVVELGHCATGALELGLPVNARRIEAVRRLCAELPTMLGEDPR